MTLAIMGGYRCVRKLGEGPRAVVWLGHPIDDSAPVAVKVLRSTDAADIAQEVEALARAAGPHVVEVADLATTADGRVALILQRLRTETLASLISVRGTLRAGEIVTVLAPLAEAIGRMHRAGVSHGSIRAASIGFTDHGAPVLACFGSARSLPSPPTPADRAADPRMVADREAFLAVARSLLEGTVGASGVLEWLDGNSDADDWLERFPDRLFAWAAPVAVDFGRRDAEAPRPVEPVLRRPRARHRPVSAEALLDRVVGLVSDDIVERVRRQVSSVRPRFWALGAAVAVALLAAATLVPTDSGDGSEAIPLPGPSLNPAADDLEERPVMGDDPAAAAVDLLETRERCIRELSILCLDAVDQPGSHAFELDEGIIRAIQAGSQTPAPVRPGEVSVEERLGGTAIVRVLSADSEPASLLLMRSEAGWRIRDYLDAP